MDDRITRADLQASAPDRFVALRQTLGVTSFGLRQIVLEPGQRLRIHRHTRQEEVYLVIQGTLSLRFEDDELDVGSGGLVRVPADVRRQLVNRGPERLSLVAIGGHGEHEGRDAEAFASWASTEPGSPQDIAIPDDLAPEDRRA